MRSIAPILVALLVLSGCAAQAPGATPPAPDGGDFTLVIVDGEPGDAPGISVAEALGHGPTDDIVTVTGALFVDADGTVRLCDSIAESFPPQCGGERIVVEGLDLENVPGLQEANGVHWAEAVTLLGSVE
jgi:hypothetical protein